MTLATPELSSTAIAMCGAGLAVAAIGGLAARDQVARARGPDRIVALGPVFFAVPLAVFGALHLFGSQFVVDLVPSYMPWRGFWVFFIGCALIAAALSITSRIGVRWSGLLFGIMMTAFVAMIHLPGAIREPGRILWTIVFREMSFGGAAWIFAALAPDGWGEPVRRTLLRLGRFWVTLALVVFGVQHFFHPTVLPGVPLAKEMPAWVGAPELIDYVTGAVLLLAAGSIVLQRRTRTMLTLVGGWILLLVLVIYGPVLVGALSDPGIGTQIVGINYFADTLLFAGVVLAAASAADVTADPPSGIRTGGSVPRDRVSSSRPGGESAASSDRDPGP